MIDKDYILRQMNDIEFIRLQFTDIFGMLKNLVIPSGQLKKALENQCMFDGSSIEGFARIEESDMYLYPDLRTFTVFPEILNQGKVARLICDVYTTDGLPFEGDPRYVLKKVLKSARDMGFSVNIGPECEFFLFEMNDDKSPSTRTFDVGGYFDLGPIDTGEIARRDMCRALIQMGFDIETAHHENAHGQHEIDFKYAEALKAADDIMTFKLVVKSIAQTHNLYATFMPKPLYGCAGSGMHINVSLSDESGQNIFYNPQNGDGLDVKAHHFTAGLLRHTPAFCCITNPLVNSYKRLVAGYEAPIYIAWSSMNRSPLVRVPAARGSGTRLELRNPDPSANPYLVLALTIAAGLDGIEKALVPPEPVEGNLFDMNSKQRAEMKIGTLPTSLIEAINLMENSAFVRKVLGEHIFRKHLSAKHEEWNDFKIRVTQWEIDQYLYKY